MPEAVVGIGSNVDPERNTAAAVAELEQRFGPLRRSSVYRSPAFGFSGDDFLNLVVIFETGLDADGVEAALSSIESFGGRRRGGPRFAPRTLDLDLLLYGCRVDARRRLPRADVNRYPFVLAPLAEIAPELRHPLTGITMADAWRLMARTAPPIERVG
jgi:2-amino-4-hydroxy-6-hydroxymethyldihydropteridine diphosphokinase